jgi:hypothetical protein
LPRMWTKEYDQIEIHYLGFYAVSPPFSTIPPSPPTPFPLPFISWSSLSPLGPQVLPCISTRPTLCHLALRLISMFHLYLLYLLISYTTPIRSSTYTYTARERNAHTHTHTKQYSSKLTPTQQQPNGPLPSHDRHPPVDPLLPARMQEHRAPLRQPRLQSLARDVASRALAGKH